MLQWVSPLRSLSTSATERRRFDAHHFACRVERNKHELHFSSFLPVHWRLMKFSVKYRCDFLLYRLRWGDLLMINWSLRPYCCVMWRVPCYFKGQWCRMLLCNDVFSACVNSTLYGSFKAIVLPAGKSCSKRRRDQKMLDNVHFFKFNDA